MFTAVLQYVILVCVCVCVRLKRSISDAHERLTVDLTSKFCAIHQPHSSTQRAFTQERPLYNKNHKSFLEAERYWVRGPMSAVPPVGTLKQEALKLTPPP